MPALYKSFRTKVENLPVREPFEECTDIRPAPYMTVEAGDIPTLQTLGFARPLNSDLPNQNKVMGGETHVLKKLNQLMSSSTVRVQKEKGLASARYKTVVSKLSLFSLFVYICIDIDLKNSFRHAEFCCCAMQKGQRALDSRSFCLEVSPWLATGCISPRYLHKIFCGTNNNEELPPSGKRIPKDWLNFELVWRDFFRFLTFKCTESTRTGAPSQQSLHRGSKGVSLVAAT